MPLLEGVLTSDTTTVEVRGGAVRTRVLTAGRGRPVVFLHGPAGLSWSPFLERLAATHRVVAPEHPGAGESQEPSGLEDLWDLVLYYDELLDALDLDRVDVVGHSFGGMVAAEVAALCPGRVGRLVLVDALGLWRDEEPVADWAEAYWVGSADPRQAHRIFADPTAEGARAVLVPPEEPKALQDFRIRRFSTIAAMTSFLWPIPDSGLRKRIHRIQAETLVIWGERDGLVPPSYAQDFADAIPGTRVAVIADAGHEPHLEQSDAVARAVLDFLA